MTSAPDDPRAGAREPPERAARVVVLALIVAALALAALWPPHAGWRTRWIDGKWESVLLDLRHPFRSTSRAAERSMLQVRVEPFRPGVDSHIVLVRDLGSALWVDGADRAQWINPPEAPLAWSLEHRMWLGGIPGGAPLPMRLGRVAFFDRALGPGEVRALARRGAGTAIPPDMQPVLVFDFGNPGAAISPPGSARLVMPPDATRDAGGLTLYGSPARSEQALRELARRIRRSQAFSVEIWWQPTFPPPPGRFPILTLAGDDGSRNVQIDVGRDRVVARVRAAHLSLSRVADLLLNVLGFVPLGLALSWGRRKPRTILAACALGFAASFGIEGLQLFRIDRFPSLLDLIANSGGAALGGLLAVLIARMRS